jgi:hypothetical protein
MNLEMLLNASVELEKRIATDQLLRNQLAQLLRARKEKQPQASSSSSGGVEQGIELTFGFPAEMCELLARASVLTGKEPGRILEESFAEYYRNRIEKRDAPR